MANSLYINDQPTKIISIGEVNLCVSDNNLAGNLLIFIHGLSGSKEDFVHYLSLSAESGWRAISYDQRGHGESSKPNDPLSYSLEALAGDLINLIESINVSRVTALGHSMGGMVLQIAALARQDLFSNLIFMDTHHGPLSIPDEMLEIAKSVLESGGTKKLLDLAKNIGLFPEPLVAESQMQGDSGYVEFCEKKFLETAPAAFIGLGRELSNCPERLDLLKNIKVPTLVIVGQKDAAFLEPCQKIASVIPRCELVEIPGSGHCPQFDQPDIWWATVSDFLSRVS